MAMRHLWCACTKFQPNPASRRALSRSQSGNGSRKTTRIIPSVSNNQILKAMRKSFVYAAGLMCLALSITDCQKELVDQTTPASEPNFELFAQPVTTKTANNGLDTRWVAEDAINVFHAEAGSTLYVSDNQFTVKDIETGRFDGTVSTSLSADKSYDWYAFYPYTSQISTPGDREVGWVTVGGTSQTQTGNGSRAHLAGESCPLYGIASNVASDKVPSISMNHLTSVIKVSVTNNSGEDLTVSSVSFTGTEDIVGTYFINFAASPVSYKSSGNAYVSSTASLTVSNGEALANGSSADFYIALKPFTAKTGSTLKLAVNGYEKTLTLKNDITFTAGHIKPLNFNYDTKLVWTLVSDANTLAAGDKLVIASNTKRKVASSLSSGYLKEESATFSSDNLTIESLPSSALVLTLGGASGNWTLANGNGLLLGATAAKKLAFGDGTTLWSISITSTGTTTIQNGTSSNGRLLHNVNSARFTTYTSDANAAMLLPQIYRLESVLPSLATPEVHAEVRDVNSVYALWSEIAGAKDYTVTCGAQSITLAGTEHTFTDLAYSTSYTISVVANPTDASVNAPSSAGTATATTGANPSVTVTDYTIIFKTATTDGSQTISKSTKASTVISDGVDYVSSFSSNCSKSYYSGKSGVKLGTGSVAGTFEFNLADAVSSNIVSIKVISAKYGSDTGTITFSADGFSLKAGINPGEDYTHSFSTPTNVKTLSFKTSTKRAYISKIVISVSSK